MEERPTTVVVCSGSELLAWDLTATYGRLSSLFGTGDSEISAVACGDIDERTVVVTGGEDGRIRIWDMSTGDETYRYRMPGRVVGVSVVENGIAAAFNGEIALLERTS